MRVRRVHPGVPTAPLTCLLGPGHSRPVCFSRPGAEAAPSGVCPHPSPPQPPSPLKSVRLLGSCPSLVCAPSVLVSSGLCTLWGLDALRSHPSRTCPPIREDLGAPQPSPLRSPWSGSPAAGSELLLGFSADFKSNLHKVYQAIEEADFFAIDGEFSGIPRLQA